MEAVLTPVKVMLVDDDPVIRLLLKDYLTAFNYEVEVLESGIQCLDRLTRTRPDVLLLDFQMPVMNGLEVLRNIRKMSSLADLPVIILSANKDSERLIKESGLDAELFIIKPFEMTAVREAIERFRPQDKA